MPKEFEQRQGETFEAWWYRVNEINPDDYARQRRGTILALDEALA